MNTRRIDLAAGYRSFTKVARHDADVRDHWLLLGSRPSRVLLFLVFYSRSSVLNSLSVFKYPLILCSVVELNQTKSMRLCEATFLAFNVSSWRSHWRRRRDFPIRLVASRDVDANEYQCEWKERERKKEKKRSHVLEPLPTKASGKKNAPSFEITKVTPLPLKAVCVFFKGIAQAGRGSFDSTLDLRASPTPFCPPLRYRMLVLVVFRLQGRFRRSRENFVLPRAFHGLDINI